MTDWGVLIDEKERSIILDRLFNYNKLQPKYPITRSRGYTVTQGKKVNLMLVDHTIHEVLML